MKLQLRATDQISGNYENNIKETVRRRLSWGEFSSSLVNIENPNFRVNRFVNGVVEIGTCTNKGKTYKLMITESDNSMQIVHNHSKYSLYMREI